MQPMTPYTACQRSAKPPPTTVYCAAQGSPTSDASSGTSIASIPPTSPSCVPAITLRTAPVMRNSAGRPPIGEVKLAPLTIWLRRRSWAGPPLPCACPSVSGAVQLSPIAMFEGAIVSALMPSPGNTVLEKNPGEPRKRNPVLRPAAARCSPGTR